MITSGTCPVCGMEMFGGTVVETPDGEEMRVCQMCHDHRFNSGEEPNQSELDESSDSSKPD